MRWLVLACLGAWGCVEANVVECENGRICPDGTVCETEHGLCVHPDQLTVCASLVEGAECALPDARTGQCDKGTCVDQECGDGVITGTEECDTALEVTLTCAEGTEEYYDEDIVLTCSSRCAFNEGVCETKCGDDIVNGPPGVEKCDGDAPAGSCLDFGFERGVLGCTSFCAPGIDVCGDIGFLPLDLDNQGIVYAVAVLGPEHYVFGAGTTISEVHGDVQTDQNVGFSPNKFWAASATNVHAVGSGGGISHFDGQQWTPGRVTPNQGELLGIWGAAPNDVWAVGMGDELLHFDGQTWTAVVAYSDTGTGWYDIHGTAANNIYMVGTGGRVQRYTTQWEVVDASACWGGSGAPQFTAVWVTSATDVMAVGNNGWICHYNGSTWTKQELNGSDNLRRLWGRSATELYATTDGGLVWFYDGANWFALDTGLTGTLYAIDGRDHEIVIGGDQRPRRYAGAAYAHPEPLTPTTFTRTFPVAPGKDYALGSSGIYRYKDRDWSVFRPFTGPGGMWVSSTGEILASANPSLNVFTIHSYNGTAWSTFAAPFAVRGLSARSLTDAYAVGNGTNQMSRYTGTWTPVTLPVDMVLEDVAVGPTNVFSAGSIVGGGYALLRFDGTTWTTHMFAANDTRTVYDVHAFADDDAYAVGDGGLVMHWDGTSWTEIDIGTKQALPQVTGTSGRDVFVIGTGDGIFHFNGVAWSPVMKPDPDAYFGVGVRDDLVLFVGLGLTTAIVRQGPWSAP